MKFFPWLIIGLLIAFTIRRYLFWFASCLPPRACPKLRTSSITILVAAKNEEALLPRLLAALERLDYPSQLLSFVLTSDGSTDATVRLMQKWAVDRPSAQAVQLPVSLGKSDALASAMAVAPTSDLVVVLDADSEPDPDALAWLAGAFADPKVCAASGYPRPENGGQSLVSRYAAMERWVYNLVVLAGKDRLNMNPPLVGALLAIRRQALVEIGGFPTAYVAEDIWISMAASNKRWRTRWIRNAVAREDVPFELKGFLTQRSRWNRGLLACRQSAGGLEDWFVVAGYLDRLVFCIAVCLAVAGWMSWWLPALYAFAPLVMVFTALRRAKVRRWTAYLLSLAFMLFIDIGVTATSAIAQLLGKPLEWRPHRAQSTNS